jgi:hypothetical protein
VTDDHGPTEYEALRATIRDRGTWRVVLSWLSLAVWAALVITGLGRGTPFALLVSLVALAAGFEGVYALHVGVERIGRYLQVFYEAPVGLPAWERTAMAYGRDRSGDGLDPIFSKLFAAAVLLNLGPILLSRQNGLILVGVVAAHAVFAVRIVLARRYVAKQRMQDLETFRRLKEEGSSGA